jgi:hypothetical protein
MTSWKARPIVAALLRAFAAGSPIVAGYMVASLVGASLPASSGWAWWLAVLGSAVAGGWLTVLLTVRFRLLAMLYELGLVFPGRAPERWDVVKQAKDPIRLRRKLAGSSIGRDQNIDAAAATVLAVAITLPRHDRLSSGYPHRVVDYSDLIARQLRIGDVDRERLKWAALSYAIGKLLLDRDLLTNPGVVGDVSRQGNAPDRTDGGVAGGIGHRGQVARRKLGRKRLPRSKIGGADPCGGPCRGCSSQPRYPDHRSGSSQP